VLFEVLFDVLVGTVCVCVVTVGAGAPTSFFVCPGPREPDVEVASGVVVVAGGVLDCGVLDCGVLDWGVRCGSA
jgi:hypothetical protein